MLLILEQNKYLVKILFFVIGYIIAVYDEKNKWAFYNKSSLLIKKRIK
jgi:hypothetical protein